MIKTEYRKKIFIAAILIFLLLYSPLLIYKVFAVSCPCAFDTEKYSAIAEGEGYCSATTKQGKDCTIVFNGNVKTTAKVEPSSIYGHFDDYLSHLKAINMELKSARPVRLMSKSDWIIKNLPLMIRSSYATAPFIDYKERETLDTTLKTLFRKFEKEISGAVAGRFSPISKENFEAEKGRFELNVKDISVSFAIFMYP